MGQAINAGAVLMDTNEFNRWQKNKLIPIFDSLKN
jgi:hypothetical protein